MWLSRSFCSVWPHESERRHNTTEKLGGVGEWPIWGEESKMEGGVKMFNGRVEGHFPFIPLQLIPYPFSVHPNIS